MPFVNWPKAFCVSAALMVAGARSLGAPMKASDTDGLVRSFGSSETSDADAIEAFRRLNETKPTEGEASLLSKAANTESFSTNRRRLAIYGLIERHCHAGTAVRKIAGVLGK